MRDGLLLLGQLQFGLAVLESCRLLLQLFRSRSQPGLRMPLLLTLLVLASALAARLGLLKQGLISEGLRCD